MGFKDSIALIKKVGIFLTFCLFIFSSQLNAQPDTLELHRIWAIDLDQDVTALRLADLDGDGTNEIFVGLWDGDSGYIEVFSGFNGIFIRRSEKIPAHKIIDLDLGDIDGDQKLEIVAGADTTNPYWSNSLVCLFDAEELTLMWTERIRKVKSVEVDNINNDDTAEAFIGTYYRANWGHGGDGFYEEEWDHRGVLYCLNGVNKTLDIMDDSTAYWRLVSSDIDKDSCEEVVCGTFLVHWWITGMGGNEWIMYYSVGDIRIIEQDESLNELATLSYSGYHDPQSSPYIIDLDIGNCDSDENKEIISYSDDGTLSVTDAGSGIVEISTFYGGRVVALALFDVDAQPPQEILIAHSNAVIEAIDGVTFDTVAITDLPLRRIFFFAFGDVTEDAMPEICISDGDSLFVYSTPVTAVEEEDEEYLASKFVLHQNYPNPFNPQTTIKYYLPHSSNVELDVYNIMGQKVKTLVESFQTLGFQSVTWDGTDNNGTNVASGVYFYRIKTDYSQETKKMILLK